jgi:ribonuclease BN (tRNA processing enzyme)
VNNYRLFKQPFPVQIVEIEALERFEILTGATAVAISTPHTAESLAIRIESLEEKSLLYTSDTGFGKDVAAFARDTDLFILESSFVRNKKTEIHLELSEAMYLIGKAKPKRALLTHFYADWDEVSFAEVIARFEPACEVIEAVDGARFEI